MEAQPQDIVTFDGRTGEGGGQLVRLAISLAAITGKAVRIDHVRGNREGSRGGGLKAQHAACIKCLQDATRAEVTGLSVGSKTVEFRPKLSPAELVNRNIGIKADSAASILLVFQALLPFLLFAGDEKGSPVTVVIEGGTNVSFSLSFEYLDQVLLPALERFGVHVERKLEYRGWSHGSRQIGSAKFKIAPLSPGKSLIAPKWPIERGTITKIDISIIVPKALQEPLKKTLLFELGLVFPDVETNFLLIEDSKHNARMYTLLVAHTSTGLRFGRDWLYDRKSRDKSVDDLSTEIAQKVVDELDAEVRKGGLVDEYLHDQLIVFQALAEGKSNIPRTKETATSDRDRVERMEGPFGDGSTHTTTARWVTGELLPNTSLPLGIIESSEDHPRCLFYLTLTIYRERRTIGPKASQDTSAAPSHLTTPLAQTASLRNIGTTQPQTFEQCCNGRIVNITQPVTDTSDPSYGVSCLAYCEVDFARTIDNGTDIVFGDYWNCLSNRTEDTFGLGDNPITGQATCGWVNTSKHDQCDSSVSVEQSYHSASTASVAMIVSAMCNTTATTTSVYGSVASKTWASCPSEITPSATSTPSATATGSKSDAPIVKGETKIASIGTGLLMLAFGLLLVT
ncbi:RNA 3'-terminal phosphate cyclase [Lachnellula suecica]|uniref:RNA 3'-terminal phosphate cyclase n=1 Tax=Lachnellula suecica TaxID=602035 RepID=A0A8T9BYU8_9HELO|nr:RNA 3'-terminal phosphate cyclase [Lachnellula suecica]